LYLLQRFRRLNCVYKCKIKNSHGKITRDKC
jgi:hypothetical protein